MPHLLSPDGVIGSPLQAFGFLAIVLAGALVLLHAWLGQIRQGNGLGALWRPDMALVVCFAALALLNLYHHSIAPLVGVFRPEVGDGGLIENLTITVMIFPVILFAANRLLRKPARHFGPAFMIAVSAALIVGFGEEISWGEHWFGLAVPDAIAETNLQGELNLHNYIRPGMMEALYYGVALVLLLIAGNLRLVLAGEVSAPGRLGLKALLVLSAALLSHHVFQELGELVTIITAFLIWQRIDDRRLALKPRWLHQVTAI
tara:strand:- start:9990 stop:10769 length:780 start_codon:yes stop_codon:yes gene_type:complete